MNATELEARRWFRQAKADLEVIRTLKSAGHYAATCFHGQQAAEKALKAVLYSQGSRVVLGHSVRELTRQCETFDPGFAALAGEAGLLDQYYIPTRYPNGLPSPAVPDETYTTAQADSAQEAAERVVDLVEAFLRSHTKALD
ncbi:MAG: HEPN domain-containing protein [Chloroflexi bacterium]|nr:HEPN domain-containing protein [Chloroflexota bacterium]